MKHQVKFNEFQEGKCRNTSGNSLRVEVHGVRAVNMPGCTPTHSLEWSRE